MKKRILQFIGSFHQGGSERQAVSLVKMLRNEGSFDVFAATLNNEGVLRSEIDGDIPEFPLTSFYNANVVKQVRLCARYLQENKIDLVHTHDFYTNVFGMAAATLAGVPVRITSKRETLGMRSPSQEFVEKIAFSLSHAIVVNSSAVSTHLIERGFSVYKINVIYNGLDLERFENVGSDRRTIYKQFGVPDDGNIRFITMVANLRHDVKNLPMLLQTAKRVTETEKNAHFVIAGEGELKNELKEQAKQLDLASNVHFIGRCTDVPSLLSISYACVLTSTAEGFSNSILEYMASGKPVVATNVGGAAEAVIDGETGYLVASDDDEGMARQLLTLLSDESRAKKMGAKGRQIVERSFSSDAQLANIIGLYSRYL